jgi:hypothetical protein
MNVEISEDDLVLLFQAAEAFWRTALKNQAIAPGSEIGCMLDRVAPIYQAILTGRAVEGRPVPRWNLRMYPRPGYFRSARTGR